ncbi:acylaminoacyl-peptidase [Heterostelium album PN500]|uniref:acylaminoacyl-peptidase n=1 Tax=Heterostelium pallidum (strain ATCC 26659 / Pp 5 / PN500) TaxID=670386 RepID=D3B4P3_HETP5|nr:acylaminoacyl-peptidase [Heterostelium album PN500]EFA84291.1 acylaminoacyl-peptidase [Heterostelium album PN500]|eukprot:XP_020436407.1 acylaminoacyl-peptidase [Heterostelium album PN500]
MSSNSNNSNSSSTDGVDPTFRNEAVALFKELVYNIPSVDQAIFSHKSDDNYVNVSIVTSVTDLQNKKDKYYLHSRSLINKDESHPHHNIRSSPFPCELGTPLISVSPSGKTMLTIKEVTPDSEYLFEFLDQTHLTRTITSKEIHKKIFSDEWFGRISWSPCEKYIAFIAERKVETTNFYDKDPKEKIVGDSFLFKNDWGETYVSYQSPSIFVIDIPNETVIPVLWPLADNITAGQVTWTQDANGLVFVGWKVETRRYGIRACFNRLSSIYYVDFGELIKQRNEMKIKQATDSKCNPNNVTVQAVNLLADYIGCFRSPRFTLDGKQLIFLGMPGIVLPHNSCSQLLSIQWKQGAPIKGESDITTLIGEKNFKDEFPGIYCQGLPTNPWIDAKTLVFHDQIHSTQKAFLFNIETKELETLSGLKGNCTIFDVDTMNRQVLIGESTPSSPTTINLVYLKDKNSPAKSEFFIYKPIYEPKLTEKITNILRTIQWDIEDVKAPEPIIGGIDKFQIIHVQPKTTNPTPLILFPHGGPHVGSTCEFLTSVCYLNALGYAVTMINYRGSTGFGRDYNDVLPGHIGTMDVADCLATLDHLLTTRATTLDRERCAVMGGSHGGFLAAHLCGLKTPRFKAAVIRNPVIDISTLSTLSDIPDWSFCEAGVKLEKGAKVYPVVPTTEELIKMRECSPISHLDNMNVPILLGLGENDLRCPPSQGMMLYNALQQKGVPTKCLYYPKTGHGLASVDAKSDQWIHYACWLKQYC